MKNPSDKPELVAAGKGYTVKYKGRHLYSTIDPVESVRRKIESLAISEKTLVFVPSIGIGYGIETLVGKLPRDSHVLCMEADPELFGFAFTQKASNIPSFDNFTCISAASPEEAVVALRRIGTWRFRRISMLVLSAGYAFHKETYDRAARLIESEIRIFWKNKMTLVRLAPLWIRNLLYNLPIVPSSARFGDYSTDRDVIVAGAGPSLEESIQCIRRMRKKAILVAVDTAFPVLMKESIKPDFIFMLEAQIANIHDFIYCRDASIPVLADITASPQVLRATGSPVCFFSSEFHPVRLLGRLDAAGILPLKLPALGSVGVAALYGALRMTSGRVYITGLDFAYSLGKTHAAGAPFPDIADCSSSRLVPSSHAIFSAIMGRPIIRMKDKNGGTAITDLVLSSYASLVRDAVGTDRNRVSDMGKLGLDLGLERTVGCADIDDKPVPAAKPRGTDPARNNAGCTIADVRSFIEREIALLGEAGKRAQAYLDLAGGDCAVIDEESMNAFREVDYAYLHFPESDPFPIADRGYMLRLTVSIMHYAEICKRSLQLAR